MRGKDKVHPVPVDGSYKTKIAQCCALKHIPSQELDEEQWESIGKKYVCIEQLMQLLWAGFAIRVKKTNHDQFLR